MKEGNYLVSESSRSKRKKKKDPQAGESLDYKMLFMEQLDGHMYIPKKN